MTCKDWTAELAAFTTAFEDYLQAFPAHGWHERYLERYRRLIPEIQLNPGPRGPGSPLFEVNSAIRLLLDGRQKISPQQRQMVRGLTVQWIRLERSAGASSISNGHSIGYDPEIYRID